ncbi:MAG: hypothetical protein QXF76_01415, partial [Candidatus Anstonellales archaeon]
MQKSNCILISFLIFLSYYFFGCIELNPTALKYLQEAYQYQNTNPNPGMTEEEMRKQIMEFSGNQTFEYFSQCKFNTNCTYIYCENTYYGNFITRFI